MVWHLLPLPIAVYLPFSQVSARDRETLDGLSPHRLRSTSMHFRRTDRRLLKDVKCLLLDIHLDGKVFELCFLHRCMLHLSCANDAFTSTLDQPISTVRLPGRVHEVGLSVLSGAGALRGRLSFCLSSTPPSLPSTLRTFHHQPHLSLITTRTFAVPSSTGITFHGNGR